MILHTMVIAGGDPWYEEAAKTLKNSVAANSPDSPLIVHQWKIPAELEALRKEYSRPTSALVSAAKMAWQNSIVQELFDGEIVGFLDADMLCLEDLSPIEELLIGYDLFVTSAVSGNKFAWNTGVVFVRVSMQAKLLYNEWAYYARRMLGDRKFHAEYHGTYGGVSQCSLAHVLQNTPVGLRTQVVPASTAQWNALNITHRDPDAAPSLVHIIGNLRKHVRDPRAPMLKSNDPLLKYVKAWRLFNE